MAVTWGSSADGGPGDRSITLNGEPASFWHLLCRNRLDECKPTTAMLITTASDRRESSERSITLRVAPTPATNAVGHRPSTHRLSEMCSRV